MAVLVEAISVIARRDAIDEKYPGGWNAFVDAAPNGTLCFDDQIARVGFMVPEDVEQFVGCLVQSGLTFLVDSKAQDLVVVDQQSGPTTECNWLEFGRIPFKNSGGTVSACWFFDVPRTISGMYMPIEPMNFATPLGWQFEGSLSDRFCFVPTGEENERLQFLRTEDMVDVFLDRETGNEVFVSRTRLCFVLKADKDNHAMVPELSPRTTTKYHSELWLESTSSSLRLAPGIDKTH